MRSHNRYFWFKGALVLSCSLLITACAGTSFRRTPGEHVNSTSVPSSACIGNAYLQKYGCSMARIDQAAKSGDPDAQYALGYMYYYGIGTVRDKQAAKLWIGRSANQGQPLAKKALALMSGGQGLHSLHRNDSYGSADSGSSGGSMGGSGAHSPARNATRYKPTPHVDDLNTATPDKPLNQVLPNYGSKPGDNSKKPESVIKSLRKKKPKSPSATPPDTAPPSVEPITKLHDPRLAPGAKPNMTMKHKKFAAKTSRPMAATTTTTAQMARAAMTSTERTMLNTAKTHYTLQLMSGRNLASIKAFIRQNHLQGKAHYYSTELDNKTWYMLVYGNYPTIHGAHVALNDLPPAIQARHPWIKSYRVVHDEIRLRKVVS